MYKITQIRCSSKYDQHTPVCLFLGHLHLAVIAFGVLSPKMNSFPESHVILHDLKFFQSNVHLELTPAGGSSSVSHVAHPDSLDIQKWPLLGLNRHFVRLRATDMYQTLGSILKKQLLHFHFFIISFFIIPN